MTNVKLNDAIEAIDFWRTKYRELEQEVIRLRASLTAVSAQRDDFKRLGQNFERDYRNTFEQSCINLQRAEKAELEVAEVSRRLAQVTTALKEFGRHTSDCELWQHYSTCSCGLADALALSASTKEGN